MTSKELILAALRLEETSRPPWLPYVGVHGAKLLGMTATEYLMSAQHICQGLQKAIDVYRPDAIPVAFDLQLEAEALGCRLLFADDNPPAVVSHILCDGMRINQLKVPSKNDGRIPVVLETTRTLRNNNPDIALYGLVTGPFTLALHLLGTELFTRLYEDAPYVTALMDFCSDVALAMSEYYIEAGCDVIALVDPMTSQIDPLSFDNFVRESMTKIFARIREQGILTSFFVCGNAEHNLELMCRCLPHNISVDENIPLSLIKNMALASGISFGGNLRLTSTLLLGSPRDCAFDALDCLDTGGTKGFVLAPGCDLPMDTPIENLREVCRVVHDDYYRETLRYLPRETDTIPFMDISQRYSPNKVLLN